MRNYALNESEAATARAALLLVEEHLLGKQKELDEVFRSETFSPSTEVFLSKSYLLIKEKLVNVKAALDALK